VEERISGASARGGHGRTPVARGRAPHSGDPLRMMVVAPVAQVAAPSVATLAGRAEKRET
jgi:hypothetical protein